jgi:glyoxylase-like metal-dependent hydrolase (beta-lactamase superfamily II)
MQGRRLCPYLIVLAEVIMSLIRINGNSGYIPGSTNSGVFLFKDKYALVIDSGDTNQDARKIQESLEAESFKIKYVINTHSHIDHCGGNIYFKEKFPGSIFFASRSARLFIANAFLFPLYIYGGNPPEQLSHGLVRSKSVTPDNILTEGIIRINEEKFEVFNLNGHAPGQVGIGTRDRVVYLGDALFSRENIDKYSFPFLFDIEEQYKTLDKIPELDYDHFVLGHGEQVYKKEEIENLVRFNRSNLDDYLNISLELLEQPHSREELLEEIVILKELGPDIKEYFFLSSTMAAMLSFLISKNQVEYQLESGRLFYYRKM